MANKETRLRGEHHPLWACATAPPNRAMALPVDLALLRSSSQSRVCSPTLATWTQGDCRRLKQTVCLPNAYPLTNKHHKHPRWRTKTLALGQRLPLEERGAGTERSVSRTACSCHCHHPAVPATSCLLQQDSTCCTRTLRLGASGWTTEDRSV